MTSRKIKNAHNWAIRVLTYSSEENTPLLGASDAKSKAMRYLRALKKHEEKTSKSVRVGEDYLSDLLNSIKYAQL